MTDPGCTSGRFLASGKRRQIAESEVRNPMLHLGLGLVIHEERQREIQRTLRNRRLLEPAREASTRQSAGRSTTGRTTNGRQEPAGATS